MMSAEEQLLLMMGEVRADVRAILLRLEKLEREQTAGQPRPKAIELVVPGGLGALAGGVITALIEAVKRGV